MIFFSRIFEALKVHIQIVHEGQKSLKCDSCGKFFSQQHNLKKHINVIHEGCKEDKCGSCGTEGPFIGLRAEKVEYFFDE